MSTLDDVDPFEKILLPEHGPGIFYGVYRDSTDVSVHLPDSRHEHRLSLESPVLAHGKRWSDLHPFRPGDIIRDTQTGRIERLVGPTTSDTRPLMPEYRLVPASQRSPLKYSARWFMLPTVSLGELLRQYEVIGHRYWFGARMLGAPVRSLFGQGGLNHSGEGA